MIYDTTSVVFRAFLDLTIFRNIEARHRRDIIARGDQIVRNACRVAVEQILAEDIAKRELVARTSSYNFYADGYACENRLNAISSVAQAKRNIACRRLACIRKTVARRTRAATRSLGNVSNYACSARDPVVGESTRRRVRSAGVVAESASRTTRSWLCHGKLPGAWREFETDVLLQVVLLRVTAPAQLMCDVAGWLSRYASTLTVPEYRIYYDSQQREFVEQLVIYTS